MTFTPAERREVIELVAKMIFEDVKQTVDFEDLITLPLDVVAQITGLGQMQVRRRFHVRKISDRKIGVSLKELRKRLTNPDSDKPKE